MLAAERYDGAEPVNLGTGGRSIRDLVKLIAALTGFEGEVRWDTSKPDGQPRRSSTPPRPRAFGFQARTGFEEGLRRNDRLVLASGRRPKPATI